MLTDVERSAIDRHRQNGPSPGPPKGEGIDETLEWGIHIVLNAGRRVRALRSGPSRSGTIIKDDGSPATEVETELELQLREAAASFDPSAVVVAEETGGELPAEGRAIAMDPIDGTRAFLVETETYSTTLVVIEDGRPSLGIVANPVTGEIAYATQGGPARLIRLSVYGEPDEARTLDAGLVGSGPALVNLHPNRKAGAVIAALYRAWGRGEISMIRSPGGSPACGLVEAARGHFVYVNLWSTGAAEPYDLLAATLIVRRAGGEVSDAHGKPIDAMRHQGPFIAALEPESAARVARVLKEGMADAVASRAASS